MSAVEPPLERRAVISGIGQSAIGRPLGRSDLDLTVEACLAAVHDAMHVSNHRRFWCSRSEVEGRAAPGQEQHA